LNVKAGDTQKEHRASKGLVFERKH
jgi:hypothetical protein